MGFSRQEYWSGLPCPPPGESSQPRDWTWVFCTAGRFFTDWATKEAPIIISIIIIIKERRRRRGRRRKKGKRSRRSGRRRSKRRSISSNLYWESTGWGEKLKGNPQRKGRSKKEAVRDPVDVEWGDKIVPFSANLFRSKLFSGRYLWRSISFNHQFSSGAQPCLTLCNLKHTRLLCPSPTPEGYSNPCQHHRPVNGFEIRWQQTVFVILCKWVFLEGSSILNPSYLSFLTNESIAAPLMAVAGRQWPGWCKELGEFRSCPFPAVFFLPKLLCVSQQSTLWSWVFSYAPSCLTFPVLSPGYLRTRTCFPGFWTAGLTGWLRRHPPIYAKRDSLKWTPHLPPKRRSHAFQALT